jgi:hypothetical protein
LAPFNNGSGGNITNAYSVYAQSPIDGTAKNFAFYADGTADNYFGGNVGIGTETPTSKLHINGSLSTNYSISTAATYTVLSDDYAIEVQTSGSTITLPTAVGIQGRIYEIDNSSTGDIILDTTGTETINGSLIFTLSSNENLKVQSNGINWRIK